MSSTELSTVGAVMEEVLLRAADPSDADAVADLHLAARAAAVPAMPPPLHTAAETRDHLRGRVGASHEVWVAEAGHGGAGGLVGYVALSRAGEPWLDDLYVAPGRTGHGIGSALLALTKSLRPHGFSLWVFDSNTGARRFYRRHGLAELERTDGSGNEEHAPDVRMAWPGRDPLRFYRRLIDDVDDELAAVVARRAALTAAVQAHKAVPGHAGRDPAREDEIARRLAGRTPDLGVDAWARILGEVISMSLDAADARSGRR